MFAKLLKVWRDTFPKSEHELMSIKYVAAIEEFNEYFPEYAAMTKKNYRKLSNYYRDLHVFRCFVPILPFRFSYASAMALDNSVEEWLEKHPQKRTAGLTGEWAVEIFADHNERVMEKYRQYKRERLEKLKRTAVERRERANKLIQKNNFRIKWILGREEYRKHIESVEDVYRKRFLGEEKQNEPV